jgi:hypothetical protein
MKIVEAGKLIQLYSIGFLEFLFDIYFSGEKDVC